jgi:hypothetical protein
MTYVFIPVIMIAVFVLYVLYLAIVKKNLKSKLQTVVLPGLFFIATWGVVYYFLLK